MADKIWDVAVIGGGPAGLAAAYVAAGAGASTVVLERSQHPRYKRCGGGLIGTSIDALSDMDIPASDQVHAVTFSHQGRRSFTRRVTGTPLICMTNRATFDDSLRQRAERAGATVRQLAHVRTLHQTEDAVHIKLSDQSVVTARAAVGADGSAGVCAAYGGASYAQVDIGLELELPVPTSERSRWSGHMWVEWGPIPGSYGWVFPKGDLLTVGVIADRRHGHEARAYLADFRARLGLESIVPVEDGGHYTRCRQRNSSLHNGRLLLAGDAAGFLDPWTREGISFALRSGALAGQTAAAVAMGSPSEVGEHTRAYTERSLATLAPEMEAGFALHAAFAKHPGVFHAALRTPAGFRRFSDFCQGRKSLSELLHGRSARAALKLLKAF